MTRWLRRGLVPVTVAPLGAWTGITLADERARSAAPYDVGLEVLAARPAPWRARPTIGLFDVHGRAALTVQPRRSARRHPLAGVGAAHRASSPTPQLTRLRAADAPRRPPGAEGRVREEALADVLRSGHGAPVDLLVTVLGLLGLPGRDLLVRGDCEGASDVEPSVRGILAFDRLMAEEAAHRAETAAHHRPGVDGVRAVSASVVVLDYGSGNIHSAVRALEHVGADVTLTADPEAALAADGLFVPGRRQLPRLHGRARRRRRTAASSTSGSPVAARCSASASGCR